MKTEVCITVDMEFSVGGAFASQGRLKPLGDISVRCAIDGREHGLGFMLDTLARSGLRATFFTEALQTVHFGDAPMGRAVEQVMAAGHDVQLHLHPCWLHFRDQRWTQPGFRPSDASAGRSDAELDEMIQIGQEVFRRWGAPAPVALRTGSFSVDRAVYRSMARQGLCLASNVGIGVNCPRDARLQLATGSHHVDGIVEVPATSYRSARYGFFGPEDWRVFAITASSKAEMSTLLMEAHSQKLRKIVVLTHPFEFIKRSDSRYTRMVPNRINQARLVYLAEFLRQHEDRFDCVTFEQRQHAWMAGGDEQSVDLRMPRLLSGHRLTQNVLNELVTTW